MVIERNIDDVVVKDIRGHEFEMQEEQSVMNMIPHSKQKETSYEVLNDD